MSAPRVLCRGWKSSTGMHVYCVSPVIEQGEPGGPVIEDGLCSLCLAHQERAYRLKWHREGKRLLRERAKGYGPQTGDAFQGFRGE